MFAPDAYLFRPGGRGNAVQRSERAVRAILRRLGEEASLPYRLIPHVVRHGWFRLMKTRGVPIEVAMKLGGHSDIRITAHIYGRPDIDDLQTAYDRVMAHDPVASPETMTEDQVESLLHNFVDDFKASFMKRQGRGPQTGKGVEP